VTASSDIAAELASSERRIANSERTQRRYSLFATRQSHACATRCDRDSGFTLLEIVVALTILGLSLTVLFGIFSQNVARTHLNEVRAEERALASSLLVSSEATVGPMNSAGRTPSGLVWRVGSAPYGGSDDEQNWPQAVSEITVTVGRAGDTRTGVTLRTLKLVPKASAP
jgi:prepilin-type N-terminal cleavage/methylation domain-containing protein